MDDHERLIRIDERQQAMGSDIKEILMQVKTTNGRVTSLESYKEKDENRATEKIKQIDEHEGRLKTLENIHLQGKGGWKTIKTLAAIFTAIGSLIALVIEFFMKH